MSVLHKIFSNLSKNPLDLLNPMIKLQNNYIVHTQLEVIKQNDSISIKSAFVKSDFA